MLSPVSGPRARNGFTLVELAVVIVIVGVLAAFGVPRFLKSVERSKAAEAFGYLSAIRSSQERYIAQQGMYADSVAKLDISVPILKYFTPDPAGITVTTGNPPGWLFTLTRAGAAAGYDGYTVTFTDEGFDTNTAHSTIASYPEINPVDISGGAGS